MESLTLSHSQLCLLQLQWSFATDLFLSLCFLKLWRPSSGNCCKSSAVMISPYQTTALSMAQEWQYHVTANRFFWISDTDKEALLKPFPHSSNSTVPPEDTTHFYPQKPNTQLKKASKAETLRKAQIKNQPNKKRQQSNPPQPRHVVIFPQQTLPASAIFWQRMSEAAFNS